MTIVSSQFINDRDRGGGGGSNDWEDIWGGPRRGIGVGGEHDERTGEGGGGD